MTTGTGASVGIGEIESSSAWLPELFACKQKIHEIVRYLF